VIHHGKLESRRAKGGRTHGFKNKILVPVDLCSICSWLRPQHLHLHLLTVKCAAALPGWRLVREDWGVPRYHPISLRTAMFVWGLHAGDPSAILPCPVGFLGFK